MRVRSFQGLRPSAAAVSRVVSLPYDVVTTAEARQLAAGNPLSMLRIVRAEINFPPGTDPYSQPVYDKAVENFRALQAHAHLLREDSPCLYLYQQQMGAHVQAGIVALCHVDDYNAGVIKRHETTRVDKEDDRTRLTAALSANAGPVFLCFRDDPAVVAQIAAAARGKPLYDLTTDDAIRHTVWRIDAAATAVIDAFAAVPCAYVADGHHRAASAARVARERCAANPSHTGDEDYNWFLSVLFPASRLQILPYHRLVRDLGGMDAPRFLEQLAMVAPVAPAQPPAPGAATAPGDVRVLLGGDWYRLTLIPEPGANPVAALDASMLQQRVLGPLLGIDDPRTNRRIDFAGGIRGTEFLAAEVAAGRAAAAFSMFPVPIDQLMAIADAGDSMPPKSTWFEPKLRSGFFIHPF